MKTSGTSLLGTPALLLVLAAGCAGEGPPGAGLTNPPSPSAVGGEKTAGRSDLVAPDPPKQGEMLGKIGDNQTNAGIGGRGPDGAAGTTDSAAAKPPANEAPRHR